MAALTESGERTARQVLQLHGGDLEHTITCYRHAIVIVIIITKALLSIEELKSPANQKIRRYRETKQGLVI